MASIIDPEQPISIHQTDYSYYIKNEQYIDIDKKTYYDKIRQK
jgi:hypothetical protein